MKWPRSINHTGLKRKTLGFLSVALGLLVAAVWVWSGWNSLSWFRPQRYLKVDAGTVDCAYSSKEQWLTRNYHSNADWPSLPSFKWWGGPSYRVADEHGLSFGLAYVAVIAGTEIRVHLVLWLFAPLLIVGGAVLLRAGMRAGRIAVGKCAACSYDLTGLSGITKCPECGEGTKRQA